MVRRPKRRPKLPTSLDELIEAGGPEAFAKQEAKQAARRERQLWLGVLERLELNKLNSDQQVIMIAIVESYIRELRRRLGSSGAAGPCKCRRDNRSCREAHSASLRTEWRRPVATIATCDMQ